MQIGRKKTNFVMAKRKKAKVSKSRIIGPVLGFALCMTPNKNSNLETLISNYFQDLPVLEQNEIVLPNLREHTILSEEAYANPNVTRYLHLIEDSAERYGFAPELIATIIHRESSGNPRALSRKGARGLMQLMPDTIKQYNVKNSNDPKENIDIGCRHLRAYVNKFGGDLALGLSAYNTGQVRVVRALEPNSGERKIKVVYDKYEQHSYHGYEINASKLPRETRRYVTSILGTDVPGF